MANLTPSPTFDSVVQLETTTVALGGSGAPMNLQAQALLNRTQYLYVQLSGLAAVASTGDYNSLINRPALGSAAFQNSAAFATAAQGAKADGAAQVSSLATVAFSGSYNDLLNKPPFISDAPSDGQTYGRRNGGWVVVSGGSILINPMTTVGDMIVGVASGNPSRLAIGSNGQVLTVSGGTPVWSAPGMTNPMTTAGDLISGGVSGAPSRVPAGSNGQVLTMVSGAPSWANASSSGMTNPMTTAGDMIVGGAGGSPARLGVGVNGQMLSLVNGSPQWSSGTSLPTTTIASGTGSSMQYKSEPNLLYMANGNLLCVYRKGSAHQSNDGILVGKISTDNGATWGSEFTVYSQGTYDTRNQGVGLDASSGRIVVFFRVFNVTTSTNVDVGYVTSTNNGVSWSAPTSIASVLPSGVNWTPFGRPQVTSLGWLMTFYQANKCYLLKSSDGGVTWTAQGYIYNLSQSAVFNEPNLIALDTSRVILILRDDGAISDYARFRYYKSADGGATWTYFGGQLYTSDSISLACPCYAVKISSTKVGVVFAARTSTQRVCWSVVDLEVFFQIPYVGWDGVTSQRAHRIVLSCARKSYDPTVTSVTDSEFGYAFPVLIPNSENVLVAWYDTGDGTNVNCSVFIRGIPKV